MRWRRERRRRRVPSGGGASLKHEMFVRTCRGGSGVSGVYLHDQIFVYVGGEDGRFDECAFGVKRARSVRGRRKQHAAEERKPRRAHRAMRRGDSLRSGKSIVMSVNMPAGAEMLQGEAEKILIRTCARPKSWTKRPERSRARVRWHVTDIARCNRIQNVSLHRARDRNRLPRAPLTIRSRSRHISIFFLARPRGLFCLRQRHPAFAAARAPRVRLQIHHTESQILSRASPIVQSIGH